MEKDILGYKDASCGGVNALGIDGNWSVQKAGELTSLGGRC